MRNISYVFSVNSAGRFHLPAQIPRSGVSSAGFGKTAERLNELLTKPAPDLKIEDSVPSKEFLPVKALLTTNLAQAPARSRKVRDLYAVSMAATRC